MHNYQWVFSGVGVAVIGWIFIKPKSITQNITKSKNVTQIAGDNNGTNNDKTKY